MNVILNLTLVKAAACNAMSVLRNCGIKGKWGHMKMAGTYLITLYQ